MKHTWMTVMQLIRSDFARYTYLLRGDLSNGKKRSLDSVRVFILCQGLQACVVYRVGQKIYHPNTSKVLRAVAIAPYFLSQRWIEMTTGISISPHAQIGKGFYIGHFGGVIIGPVRIGDNCNISHGVTLGQGVARGSSDCPTLGNRVWIGPGAKITGPVALGDDCVVGANAVVLKSVPARALAVGIPAKIRPDRGSFDVLVYEGMQNDVARSASLALLETGGEIAPSAKA